LRPSVSISREFFWFLTTNTLESFVSNPRALLANHASVRSREDHAPEHGIRHRH
jgi:hypothetical protein